MGTPTLTIDRRTLIGTLFAICASIEMMWFALDYHLNYSLSASGYGMLRRLFATSREDSLAGWFSIMQTAMVAITLWLLVVVVRHTGSRLQTVGWTVLAGFFTYLAFDDGAHIHERVGTAYHDAFTSAGAGIGAWTLDLFPSYRWQIVFMPIFAAMGLFILGFLMRQLKGWKPKVVVFAALSCLAFAVVLDFFEGLSPDHALNPYTAIVSTYHLEYWSLRNFGTDPYAALLHFSKSFEETIEMFAMTMLWCVFLWHLSWVARDLRIQFVTAGPVPLPESAGGRERSPGLATPIPAG